MEDKAPKELTQHKKGYWILETEDGPIRFTSLEEYAGWKKEAPKKEEPAAEEEQMAVRRKRRSAKRKSIPTNKALYSRVKAAAKRKFAVYPSAYANAWLVREYKKRGGKYRSG